MSIRKKYFVGVVAVGCAVLLVFLFFAFDFGSDLSDLSDLSETRSETQEGSEQEHAPALSEDLNFQEEFQEEEVGQVREVAWNEVEDILESGSITAVMERKSLEARLASEDGTIYVTEAPKPGATVEAVQDCGLPCSGIIISTE